MALESDPTEINRRENARALVAGCGSQAKFAEKVDRSPGQVNHWIGPKPTKNIGKDLARHIEQSFGKPEFWLDQRMITEGPGLDSPAAQEAAKLFLSLPEDEKQLFLRMLRKASEAATPDT